MFKDNLSLLGTLLQLVNNNIKFFRNLNLILKKLIDLVFHLTVTMSRLQPFAVKNAMQDQCKTATVTQT